jgi:hypothetical protein
MISPEAFSPVMNAILLLNISIVGNFVNQHFRREKFRIGAAKPVLSWS